MDAVGSAAPQFIAEVSSNHNRDLDRARAFVRGAADAGCDSVKFQLFRVNELFAPEVLSRSEEHLSRARWELPVEFLPELAKECAGAGVSFSCTPFYLGAVEILAPYVDFFKIASYELLWDDLLVECARAGKPVVISTGMATMEEIDHAVSVSRAAGAQDLTLLHCVSSYPAPPEECNLAAIATMRAEFGCKVGWSDHSVDPAVIARAVHRWGAEVVEVHFDLDESGAEYPSGHCWLPARLKGTIESIRRGFDADGIGEKAPAASEQCERDWRADPADGLRPMRSIRDTWDA